MKTVVLLSGGLDSTVALAAAVRDGDEVYALTVDYGQRHVREVDAAQAVAKHYGVHHEIAHLPHLLFKGSALTSAVELPEGHAEAPDETFVPGRNTVLLALATAYAESIGARVVVLGANADDQAGYPDCRWKFLDTFREAVSIGTEGKVWLHFPLMRLTKAEILKIAWDLGVPGWLTYSCYAGGELACGKCGACVSNLEAEWANVSGE